MSRPGPAALVALLLAGCGTAAVRPAPQLPADLLAGMRPIGPGERFHPSVRGRPTGPCHAAPGPSAAHLELFAANRVVLIPAGVGRSGRCFGSVSTLDPTGVIHFRTGAKLSQLFVAWGRPLGPRRILSFTGVVRAYLAGHRVAGLPALTQHAEIVLEVGPYVPPHRRFVFTRAY